MVVETGDHPCAKTPRALAFWVVGSADGQFGEQLLKKLFSDTVVGHLCPDGSIKSLADGALGQ